MPMGAPSLADVVISHELGLRPVRSPNRDAENGALLRLTEQLLQPPEVLLQALADAAIELCHAGTAGVSLLETDVEGVTRFRWVVLAGKLRDAVGGTTPRDFSPCGTCIDRGTPQLYQQPGRYFTYLEPAGIMEGLVLPLLVEGEALGTVWIVSHDEARHFDAEDVRLMTSLAHFTANAFRLARLKERSERLHQQLVAEERRKDEFLAMLAHELRNPLASMLNAVELLHHRAQAPEKAEVATNILGRQVKHLARLVDDLLDVSRLTRGHIELRREQVELAKVIDLALETVRPSIAERGQQLWLSLPGQPVWLEADAFRLQQVFANILGNATKYTDPGGSLWLKVQLSGDRVEISIKDSGMGIPAELLPRVFDLFAQAERSLARSEGGLGVGLTLVKRLVEQHGGRVVARSEGPGKGAEFVVQLPLPTLERSAGPDVPAPTVDRPSRVLLVDDNVDATMALSELLKLEGYPVWIAHDGPQAIRSATELQPDVILLDIGLPGMDGYAVADAIRRIEPLKRVSLIAISGYAQQADRQRSVTAGFDHHLAKPVDLELLRNLLKQPERSSTPADKFQNALQRTAS